MCVNVSVGRIFKSTYDYTESLMITVDRAMRDFYERTVKLTKMVGGNSLCLSTISLLWFSNFMTEAYLEAI